MTDLRQPTVDAISVAGLALHNVLDAVTAMQLPDPFALIDKTGTVDVTDAIQKAIDQGIDIPTGLYLVQPGKLVAKRDVTMAADAILLAKPNALTRYTLLRMEMGTALTGGRLIGDRATHDYSGGASSEWCMGLMLPGGNTITDTVLEQFPGDGMEATGPNITLENVSAIKCGRNGGSGFNLSHFVANRCTFGYTGALDGKPGAPKGPWCGFDIEPDGGGADDIAFNECQFPHNDASGVLVWTRSSTGASVSHVLLNKCLMDGNPNGVEAKGLGGPVSVSATSCTLQGYKGAAFKVGAGATVSIDGNTMRSLTARATSTKPGRYDLQVTAPGVIVQGTNTYTGPVA